MYKTGATLMMLLSIMGGISAMGAADPVASAIKGLESTLLLIAALALFVVDDLRGDK